MISHGFLVALSLQLLGLIGQALSKNAGLQRLRNRSNGTGGRVLKVIDCPGGRVLKGLESSTGCWGLWQWWLRPPGSLAAVVVCCFACSFDSLRYDCLLFGQLLRVCAVAVWLPTFWANRGLLVARGARGGWRAVGTSGHHGGSLQNRGNKGDKRFLAKSQLRQITATAKTAA